MKHKSSPGHPIAVLCENEMHFRKFINQQAGDKNYFRVSGINDTRGRNFSSFMETGPRWGNYDNYIETRKALEQRIG